MSDSGGAQAIVMAVRRLPICSVLWRRRASLLQAHKANSHSSKGWEVFTDAVISHVTRKRQGLVFMLWGKHAQKRKDAIMQNHHTVLEAAHPSGLSCHRGFFGCEHFLKCNDALEKRGCEKIKWQITE
jgi:uracil-DNA glycosylase